MADVVDRLADWVGEPDLAEERALRLLTLADRPRHAATQAGLEEGAELGDVTELVELVAGEVEARGRACLVVLDPADVLDIGDEPLAHARRLLVLRALIAAYRPFVARALANAAAAEIEARRAAGQRYATVQAVAREIGMSGRSLTVRLAEANRPRD